MPLLGTRAAGSARGFGRFSGGGGARFADESANGTVHASGGRVVLNGYGLLFYIGSSGVYNTWGDYGAPSNAAKNYWLTGFGGVEMDISLIGGGGCCTGGGGGGGSGGGGCRFILTPTGTVGMTIGGGYFTHWLDNDGQGRDRSNSGGTFVYNNASNGSAQSGNQVGYGQGGGGSATSGGTYTVSAPASLVIGSNGWGSGSSNTGPSVATGASYSRIAAVDGAIQADYGGNGAGLSPFSAEPNQSGSGLGGGGGCTGSGYGGDRSPGAGGRYGYSGGFENPSSNGSGYSSGSAQANSGMYGFGPSPGESNSHRYSPSGNNSGGGGGSFGGGGGDDGSGASGFGYGGSGAGGAVLIRLDTVNGFFVSGRPGWNESTGPWTG